MTRIEEGIFAATFAHYFADGDDDSTAFVRACEAVGIFRHPDMARVEKLIGKSSAADDLRAIFEEAKRC